MDAICADEQSAIAIRSRLVQSKHHGRPCDLALRLVADVLVTHPQVAGPRCHADPAGEQRRPQRALPACGWRRHRFSFRARVCRRRQITVVRTTCTLAILALLMPSTASADWTVKAFAGVSTASR